MSDVPNPSEPAQLLKRPLNGELLEEAQPGLAEDSAVTKAEKAKRHCADFGNIYDPEESDLFLPPTKRVKLDSGVPDDQLRRADARDKVKGVALVKEECVLSI